ncbi:serine O-acetyltransferase [Rhodoferax ferrireducens T118]|uniref:Serine O-acetyltransferase n=1 Tax=Albidiferax ferrireducens (strain ATCC BAA-621 / DSM 15236 / T118) TaxID=338969 RepID=Q21Z08_ALBFT|nr:serine O-acetyltransferase [Rhodoferax ferrireducens]ABD68995.1 serine O-acetyltransferase [Rhodoferax ferrireducens T118]
MNDALKMNTAEDFRLLTYLAADLRRARVLLNGSADGVSGLRLWLGVLSPRFVPVLLCRLAHSFYRLKLGLLAKAVSLLNFFLFGIEIAVRCPIGKGLFLPHTQGTVIGAWSIGENVTIFQGVTLGAKELDFSYQESSRPTVGDGVTIGAGAKVIGGLVLGSDSRVGANAVVLNDVAPGSLVVGIPAKVVDRSGA